MSSSSSSSSSSLSENHVSQPNHIARFGSKLSNGLLRENGDTKPSERSPLLSSSRSEEEPTVYGQPRRDTYDDDYFQRTKSIWYLILTTIGIGGLQMAWACELSNGSPYLLSLGLSKSHLSLAWVAGPLTGTFVQPFVGIMSDKSRISWGKRKPFILGGAAATIIFLLFLPWSKEIMRGILGLFGVDSTTGGGKVTTVIVAVISIYFLDVALNTDPTYDNTLVASNAPDETTGDIPGHSSGKTLLEWLIIPGFTLKRAWMLSHILFAASMFSAPFIRTVQGANVIIGLFGITWAMTLWAPWAIISAEISHRDLLIRAQKQRLGSIIRDEQSEAALEALDEEERRLQAEAESNETGVIMGIHNMAIAAPQFIATIVCSIVFGVSEKPRGVPGDHSIGVAFAVGGFFVLIAAFMVLRIKDDDSMPADAIAAAERGGSATVHSKKETGQTRTSMRRATLARNTSFASGLEY
ncbi:hypothetical protein DL770_002868 [Monosporascus sp. CRB-9-2]|nr:hypothetical protein DL770_002868 [Monosporascus sp. CRB-9-2]